MNIIISHVYSNDNKGDAALLSVLLQDIRRAFDNASVTILTMDTIKKGEMFEGVPVKNSFMYYASDRYKNPVVKMIYSSFLLTSTLTWAVVYRYTGMSLPLPKHLRDIAILYRDADLIIPVGGGYIRSTPGFINTMILLFILHPLLFASVIRKPTVNYTQSIGPFGNAFQEWMAKFTLRKVSGIIPREKISLDLLTKWGLTKNIFLSVDSGFLFKSSIERDLRGELGVAKDRMIVGVTVRNWLPHRAQENYEKIIATFCDYIVNKYNAAIIFIPQVTVDNHHDDDRESSKKVYAFMECKENASVMTERYDHQTIKALYANLDYLIGTRFHSVIFALTSYIPAIAVGYEYKTLGIMMDLGLEEWVLDIKNVQSEQLINLFEKLITHRDEYVDQLRKRLPSYIKQAEQSIYFVKDLYEGNQLKVA